MVQDQGAILDRVEHHVNNTADYVHGGHVGEEGEASERQDDPRCTKKVILVLLFGGPCGGRRRCRVGFR